MSVPTLHEDDVEALGLPGRQLSWLVASGAIRADNCSACMIRVAPGDKVRPAHAHPLGEEVIYIVRGTGRVLVAVAPLALLLLPGWDAAALSGGGVSPVQVKKARRLPLNSTSTRCVASVTAVAVTPRTHPS